MARGRLTVADPHAARASRTDVLRTGCGCSGRHDADGGGIAVDPSGTGLRRRGRRGGVIAARRGVAGSAVRVAGGVLWLDMPEMGAVGWRRVKAVTPCPPLEAGGGPAGDGLVPALAGLRAELRVQGEAKVIGVTLGHPFWSMDRSDWVPVGELRVGERLLAWDGSTPVVESLGLRELPEAVYTVEVDGDHCYRVGEQGLLVHNQSQGETGAGATQQQPCEDECYKRWPDLQKANPFYQQEPVANVVSNSGQSADVRRTEDEICDHADRSGYENPNPRRNFK